MLSPVELAQKLAQYEDAETAIAVYREANLAIAQYEEVKKAALNLAENELRSTGEMNRKTLTGSCGWTQPKAAKLDKEAWQRAILENDGLKRIQIEFEGVEINLKEAQLPYMKLPEGTFFIR